MRLSREEILCVPSGMVWRVAEFLSPVSEHLGLTSPEVLESRSRIPGALESDMGLSTACQTLMGMSVS